MPISPFQFTNSIITGYASISRNKCMSLSASPLASAPLVFGKLTCPIVAWLRQLGIRMVAYIYDFLLLAGSKEEAHHLQAQLMLTLSQALRFSINTKKSLMNPCHKIEFLGVMIQSHTPALHPPLHKLQVKSFPAPIQRYLQINITVREIAQFIGTANAAAVAIPLAPLFYRSLQATKK